MMHLITDPSDALQLAHPREGRFPIDRVVSGWQISTVKQGDRFMSYNVNLARAVAVFVASTAVVSTTGAHAQGRNPNNGQFCSLDGSDPECEPDPARIQQTSQAISPPQRNNSQRVTRTPNQSAPWFQTRTTPSWNADWQPVWFQRPRKYKLEMPTSTPSRTVVIIDGFQY